MVIKIPDQVNRALEILFSKGHSAFVVGGAVRDSVMGKTADDWDIACSALPEETCKAFAENGYSFFETGIKHGTVTVVIEKMNIEITTFRIDEGYTDGRHPDKVVFSDKIEEDLSRRDFTVNAMAYSPKSGILDVFGGMNDIENKLIRCVGEPDKRFGEDALRMLRALRFSSVLGFDIEEKTADSIRKNFRSLSAVSRERIYAELRKLLCGTNARKILVEWSQVIFFVLPQLAPMKDCTQHHERHIFDVWGHTAAAVESIDAIPELRLAMLLHDSGKPHCKTTDENGIDHFYGHGKLGVKIAEEVLDSLKTSTATKKKVCELVEYHDFLPDKISKATYKKYISRLGIETIKELFKVREADIKAQNPVFIEESMKANLVGLEILSEIENEKPCFGIKDLEINGRDIAALGVAPSKRTGEILNALFDEIINEKIENDREALLKRASEMINGKCV